MKMRIFFKVLFLLSLIINLFCIVAFVFLKNYFKDEKPVQTLEETEYKIEIKDKVLNDNIIFIKYNLEKTKENTYFFDCELYYNEERIKDSSVILDYALSENEKNKLLFNLGKSNIYRLKGSDDVDYLLFIMKDFYNEYLYIINNEGVLLTKFVMNGKFNIFNLIGDNKDMFFINHKYEPYVIKNNKMFYLKRESCEEANDIIGYEIEINENVTSANKIEEFIYDGEVKCLNIDETFY